MDQSLIRAATDGDQAAWTSIVEAQGPAVWEYASRLGARWQAIDASEAVFLNLADRGDEVGDDIVAWLRTETEAAMRTVQTATWRTPRPVIVDDGAIPETVAATAERAIRLRVDGASRFTPSVRSPSVGEGDVVIPWREGGPGLESALVSWYRRYDGGDLRLDVSLLADAERRVLLYPSPTADECWVRTPSGPIESTPDALGYWRAANIPEVPLSFAVRRGGSVAATDWVAI